jgi:hypothetical protein
MGLSDRVSDWVTDAMSDGMTDVVADVVSDVVSDGMSDVTSDVMSDVTSDTALFIPYTLDLYQAVGLKNGALHGRFFYSAARVAMASIAFR